MLKLKDNLALLDKRFFYLIAFFCIFIFFAAIPVTFAFDWFLLRSAIIRMFSGQEIYIILEDYGVFAPPWVFLMLSPAALLPQQVGWGLINTLSIFSLIYLAQRYKVSKVTTFFLVFSPPMAFSLIYGNIDALMLFLTIAPIEFMPLVAISKPQVVFGVIFRFLHQAPAKWLRAALISGAILLLSLLIFGFWPARVVALAAAQFSIPRSPLSSIWPAQLILAVALVGLGYWRKDERFYLAASPFMFSYASIGNFMGLLLMLCSWLKWWQSCLLISAWWVFEILTYAPK